VIVRRGDAFRGNAMRMRYFDLMISMQTVNSTGLFFQHGVVTRGDCAYFKGLAVPCRGPDG
jgi:hypothetical protein